MIDLTAAPVTRASCYQLVQDATLPHQLIVGWSKTGYSQQFVTARCNCGYVVGTYSPEDEPLPMIGIGYGMHVESLL